MSECLFSAFTLSMSNKYVKIFNLWRNIFGGETEVNPTQLNIHMQFWLFSFENILEVYLFVVLVTQSLSDSLPPHGLTVASQAPLSMGILQVTILEWVAMHSSRSSQPGDRIQVFCIAGRFFTVWATREALTYLVKAFKNFDTYF